MGGDVGSSDSRVSLGGPQVQELPCKQEVPSQREVLVSAPCAFSPVLPSLPWSNHRTSKCAEKNL